MSSVLGALYFVIFIVLVVVFLRWAERRSRVYARRVHIKRMKEQIRMGQVHQQLLDEAAGEVVAEDARRWA